MNHEILITPRHLCQLPISEEFWVGLGALMKSTGDPIVVGGKLVYWNSQTRQWVVTEDRIMYTYHSDIMSAITT